MQEEEPSILASLGIDPTTLTEPPPGVWDAAVQAAFDPGATADPDTVPDMDDTAPADPEDVIVVDDPAADHHVQLADERHSHDLEGGDGDAVFGDVPADTAGGDHGDHTDPVDHDHIHHDDSGHPGHDDGHHDI